MMEGPRVARHRFLFVLQQSFVVVYVVAIGRASRQGYPTILLLFLAVNIFLWALQWNEDVFTP